MNETTATEQPELSGYAAARQLGGAAIRERADIGLLELTGRDRQSFLQGMVTNDVLSLAPGQSVPAAFLDSTAHLLAVLTVHCRPDSLLLAADTRCLERLARTLDKYLIMEKVRIADVSNQWSLLSVVGDGAPACVERVLPESAGFVHWYAIGAVPVQDVWQDVESAPAFREGLLAAGAVPLSDDAWETLRVEGGVPAWGQELTESVLFPEAGLDHAVSYTKGCYLGQEIVARVSARGHANRSLRAILLAHGEAVPTPGDTVHLPQDAPEPGREIGRITSAVHSPLFDGRALALGYLRREYLAPGTEVAVHLRQPNGAVFAAQGEVTTPGEGP